jgi:hypothetical protein
MVVRVVVKMQRFVLVRVVVLLHNPLNLEIQVRMDMVIMVETVPLKQVVVEEEPEKWVRVLARGQP